MATVQSEVGQIRMFDDFLGAGVPLVLGTDYENVGPFVIGGEGIEQTDTSHGGAPILTSSGNNGIIQLHTDNEDLDTIFIRSGISFAAGAMGTLVLETRLKFIDLDNKAAFIGWSSVCDDDADLDTDIIGYSATTTVVYRGSHLCGFYLSSELGDDEDWHTVYKGGTATAITATGSIDLDNKAVVGDYQILRLEVDNDGTARWLIDGVLKKTLKGAMSTTGAVCAVVAVTANTSDEAIMDVDYVLVEANRDWTV